MLSSMSVASTSGRAAAAMRRAACRRMVGAGAASLPLRAAVPAIAPRHHAAPNNNNNRAAGSRAAVRARAALADAALVPVMERGELSAYPDQPGVYAVYDKAGALQYIGLSRKVSASVSAHLQALPDLTHAVRAEVVADGGRDALTAAWKQWMEQAIAATGTVPPGNAPGETRWSGKPASAARQKPEIKLTAGKAINVPLETLIDGVVRSHRVVAFVKGTRLAPQCGFSHKMLTLLNDCGADYEVVNVLDEFHNPGLRDAIKAYSAWPTIPQLYIGGEFVGGADIAEQMAGNGELQTALRGEK